MNLVTKVVLLALLSTLWGCTNNLHVKGDLPTPLISPIPQSMGVFYDDEFRNYVYTEQSEDRGKWIIDNGDAQVQLFEQVIPKLFKHVEVITSLPTAELPAATDLVIHPKVTDFQYSVPRETRFKIFEVWIKYNLTVYDAQGRLVADWIATAYGKTPTAFMQSNEEAMNAAIIVALRDLGANLSIGALRVPEIKAWLDKRPAQPSSSVPPANQQARAEG